MIVPRVFKSRQRKRKNISIVLSSQQRYRGFPGTFFLYIEKAERPKLFACLLRGIFVIHRIAGRFF